MRTTVTLDPDVERLLKDRMTERGVSFKQALNEAARSGLSGGSRRPGKRFAQRTFAMGTAQEFRWDKALSLAEAMEDEERSRKLLLRK
jgi:hypothetical protein